MPTREELAFLQSLPLEIKIAKSRQRIREWVDYWGPDKTFLEPSCGNGSFLVEILDRKYKACQNAKDGLKALASVAGIDILPDNVQESRARLLKQFCERLEPSETVILLASGIIRNNIICGDSLKIMREWEERS